VLSVIIRRNLFEIRLKSIAIALLAILAAISLTPARLSTQNMPIIIGRIEGDDLAVKTTTTAGIEIDAGPTVVASGSDVTVRSGHARILLDSGGEISICGPAHFTLVNSTGAITLALDYGRVHPSLSSSETFTIYTPSVVATPVAISGARRDTTLGLDQNGEMCIFTARGAMRVEPQFAGQSLIVPQGGIVNLADGQVESLHSDASSCSCEFPRAAAERPRPPISREIAALRRRYSPTARNPTPRPRRLLLRNRYIPSLCRRSASMQIRLPRRPIQVRRRFCWFARFACARRWFFAAMSILRQRLRQPNLRPALLLFRRRLSLWTIPLRHLSPASWLGYEISSGSSRASRRARAQAAETSLPVIIHDIFP